jgi:hypothetical protein
MTLRTAALAVLCLLLPVSARAVVQAHFRVESVDGGCRVDGEDQFPLGDPERYFRLAVFDANSSAIFNACANGCTDDGVAATPDGRTFDYCPISTGCGLYNFPNQETTKIIPNGSGAYFYFGLFDEDAPIDADDSLGDHWQFASGFVSATPSNNNVSPYYPSHPIVTACSDPVEGLGSANNYSVTYRIWFSDTDGPAPLAEPQHWDNGMPSDYNDDTLLEFRWALTSDPHSGISGYRFSLFDGSTASFIFMSQPAPSDGSITICPVGCDGSYAPVTGHIYEFMVMATNGNFPTLTNDVGSPATTTVFSPWTMMFNSPSPVDVPSSSAMPLGLARPSPNPSPGPTLLRFALPAAGHAALTIVDVQGRRVRTLVDGELEAGPHQLNWDGRDDAGASVDSGVYWAHLSAAGQRRVRCIVVTR